MATPAQRPLTYYRLFRLESGARLSTLAPPALKVRFPEGDWVSAPTGPLFVYDHLSRALEVAEVTAQNLGTSVEVWKVLGREARPCPDQLPMLSWVLTQNMDAEAQLEAARELWGWWPDGNPTLRPHTLHRPHSEGITLVSALKLVERIKTYQPVWRTT